MSVSYANTVRSDLVFNETNILVTPWTRWCRESACPTDRVVCRSRLLQTGSDLDKQRDPTTHQHDPVKQQRFSASVSYTAVWRITVIVTLIHIHEVVTQLFGESR